MIAVLCALPEVELPALLSVFDLLGKDPHFDASGKRYWETTIKKPGHGDLRIIIGCTAVSGNSDASRFTEKFIAEFHPEFLMFCGIACGTRAFEVGDVVAGGAIWAYEYVKTKPSGDLSRSRAKVVPTYIQEDLAFFAQHKQWRDRAKKLIEQLEPSRRPRQIPAMNFHHSVWIASGEKVTANSELARPTE